MEGADRQKLPESLKRSEYRNHAYRQKPYHTLLTELHEVAAGRVEEDSIRIDLKDIRKAESECNT